MILATVTATTKIATGYWATRRAGIAVPGRWRAGGALVARGEFSIVIAGLAVAAQIEPRLGALATAYVLLLVIIGPLTARYAEPIAHGLTRRLARPAVRSETLALDYPARAPARTRARIGAGQERRKQAKP